VKLSDFHNKTSKTGVTLVLWNAWTARTAVLPWFGRLSRQESLHLEYYV